MSCSFAGCVGWLLCPALAFGQVAASGPETTFQVTSRIVYVDVVVRDGYGRIVRGLTQKDFHVLEDGKEQRIDFFRDHTHDAITEPARTPAGDGQLVFSNVDTGGEAANSVNIILFDFFNTASQDQLYARQQMIRFLEALPPGRQTALFVLGTRLQMLQGFTGSTDRLLAAAKAMRLDASSVQTVGAQQQDIDQTKRMLAAMGRSAASSNAVGGMYAMQPGQDALRSVDITQTALQQLSAAVSGYPGRKNLFWLADTFPLYGGPALEINDLSQAVQTNTMSLQDIAGANNKIASAQIAIYPISLAGLEVGGAGPEVAGQPDRVEFARQFNDRSATHARLDTMAHDTGGQAYYGTNDFAGALQRGFEDGSNYYTVAYRPENQKWNGQFRKIAVKFAEHGYSLGYRRGYYALPDQTAEGDTGNALQAALQPDTPEATMLLLKSQVALPDAGHPAVRVDSVIDPRNVEFQTDARGRRHAQLLVTLMALPDPKPGTTTDDAKKPVQPPQTSGMYVVDLDADAFRKLLASGMPMHQEMALAPGRYRLRLGVCDLRNHRLGTLDMPVVVGSGPEISQ